MANLRKGKTMPKKRTEARGKTKRKQPTTGPVDDTTVKGTEHLPQDTGSVVKPTESLTDEEFRTIRDIVRWWTKDGEKIAERLTSVNVENLVTRPAFPGYKANSGIRVKKKLMEDAVAKAKEPGELQRTGGNLSSLIETLLWAYLDHDKEYLQEHKKDGTRGKD